MILQRQPLSGILCGGHTGAFFNINPRKDKAACYEKEDQRKNTETASARHLADHGKQERSENSRKFAAYAIEPEELGRFGFWDHSREKRPADRLGAALRSGHKQREGPKMPRFGHEISAHRHQTIDSERQENCAFCSQTGRQTPEQNRKRYADKLNYEQSAYERLFFYAYLCLSYF